ncbi:Metallo-dependent phosphatase-like protein [Mycena alexandri]|uniref:Metallo-dependent phosphatase-like protein n=1 Tax=Mycena alexandri TaxID=1745969 RepID=A0AAD6X1G1_9AGAR|nr:Metallo-dependent phosphatase-like protein [Mycena alexandri]KAJ7033082.1 Metallo-dependent phosphatase-like protein [Mycena alexandri]
MTSTSMSKSKMIHLTLLKASSHLPTAFIFRIQEIHHTLELTTQPGLKRVRSIIMTSIALPRRTRITSPTSVVQLEYSPDPLPKPASTPNGETWTRFVLLSDTHSRTFPVPDGDVLLHSGDLCRRGTLRDLRRTMEWLYALPHPLKIIIAGNRDYALDREWYDANWNQTIPAGKEPVWEPPEPVFELLTGPRAKAANIVYLKDEEYKFRAQPGGREWSVYGSPLSPNFGSRVRAFGYDAADAEAVVSSFPQTDILLTHGGPLKILDLTKKGVRAGCHALTARLPTLQPRLHVFGHIHEARGAYVHLWSRTHRLSLGAQNSVQMGLEAMDVGDEVVSEGEQTIFVNAANTPAGQNEFRNGEPVDAGGPGVQPVVVDLRE